MEDDNKVTSLGNHRKQKEEKLRCEACDIPTEELIYVCGNCQCRTWRLMANGGIECSTCDTYIHPDEDGPGFEGWRRIADTAPKDPEAIASLDDDKGTINNHSHGSVSIAQQRILKTLGDAAKNDELSFAGGYKTTGEGFWWFGADDVKSRDWIVGQMADMIEHVKKQTYEGEKEGGNDNARAPDEA